MVPQRDPQGLIAQLSKHFPEEKEGIRGIVQEMVGIVEEANKLEEKKGGVFKFPRRVSKDVEYPEENAG